MSTTRFIVLLLGMLSLLGGCEGSRFTAQVSQFHKLAPSGAGQSFMVTAVQPAKNESLEFEAYAERVIAELETRGFHQARHVKDSDLMVLVDYGVEGSSVERYPVPVYGYYPGEYRRVHGVTRKGERFSARIYERGGFVPLGYTEHVRTLYKRVLSVDIVDAQKWRKDRTVKVYEGRVVSMGPENEISAVMPLMIRALFVEFPGPSGKTQTIVLDPQP